MWCRRSIVGLIDDLLVYRGTEEEHHQHLSIVLQKLKEAGVTLNKDKCAVLF